MAKDYITSKTLFWAALNLTLIAVTIIVWKVLLVGLPVLPERGTVTVTGDGKAVVAPDIARLSFSVVTEGKDPKVIQTENTKKMNAAIDFVKSQGIEAKDIKTTNYSLYPRYDYVTSGSVYPGRQVLAGYTITQGVQVKVRDLEKVASVLGGLPDAGINQIESVSFDIDDPDAALNMARKEAFEKARSKAEAMARENGVRIKRVVTFSESLGGWPIPFYAEKMGLGAADGGAPLPALQPGSQDVTVQVTVTYEIR